MTPPASADNPAPTADYVYRRVPPKRPGQPRDRLSLSNLRPKPGQGLSVYLAETISPSDVLMGYLTDREQRLGSADAEAKTRAEWEVENYGSTVEQLVAAGWRIAKIPVVAFPAGDFTWGPVEPTGHIEVIGEVAVFESHFDAIAEGAEILAPSQCL